MIIHFFQVNAINTAIENAKSGDPLYKLPLVEDPSPKAVEMCVYSVQYFTKSRKYNQTAEDLKEVHSRAVNLIQTLQRLAPSRNGAKAQGFEEATGWNLRKVHTLLHRVSSLVELQYCYNSNTILT